MGHFTPRSSYIPLRLSVDDQISEKQSQVFESTYEYEIMDARRAYAQYILDETGKFPEWLDALFKRYPASLTDYDKYRLKMDTPYLLSIIGHPPKKIFGSHLGVFSEYNGQTITTFYAYIHRFIAKEDEHVFGKLKHLIEDAQRFCQEMKKWNQHLQIDC